MIKLVTKNVYSHGSRLDMKCQVILGLNSAVSNSPIIEVNEIGQVVSVEPHAIHPELNLPCLREAQMIFQISSMS